ncbi:MAG: PriCT-2 domain-containing protein [Elioraea sp.]|nr:PriCT-2 domain-containing protein [Elioraea sp.]
MSSPDRDRHHDDREWVEDALCRVPADDRDVWIRIGMALHSAYGDDGYPIWLRWSQRSSKFNQHDAEVVWRSFRSGGVTLATLFYLAERHGWTPPNNRRPQRLPPAAFDSPPPARRDEPDTAKIAYALWVAAIHREHPYLQRKRLPTPRRVRVLDDETFSKIAGYLPSMGGEALRPPYLLVPLTRGERVCSLEIIDVEGRKASLRGRRHNAYWLSRLPPLADRPIVIAEGMATALAVAAAVRWQAAASIGVSAMAGVIGAMREDWPALPTIMIAADLDERRKPHPVAVRAATVHDLPLLAPPPDIPGKDWADLYLARGRDAVADAVLSTTAVRKFANVTSNHALRP